MTLEGLNEDFRDLLVLLADLGVEFLVVGAYALAFHGAPRASGDIDVFVRPSEDNARRVFEALRRFGAPLQAAGVTAAEFEQAGMVSQLGLPPRRIDLLTESLGRRFRRSVGLSGGRRGRRSHGLLHRTRRAPEEQGGDGPAEGHRRHRAIVEDGGPETTSPRPRRCGPGIIRALRECPSRAAGTAEVRRPSTGRARCRPPR